MTTDHSASGPALGYLYQFDRATYRLFQSEIDVIEIGVEDIDDVSVHKDDGKDIHEQDKSTVNKGSPLSDRSVALWKTLHIWAEFVLKDPTILKKVEFHLVTNGTLSTKCLARRINDTVDEKSSKVLCKEMRTIVPTLREDLAPFGITLNKLSDRLLKELIMKISIFDKMCPKFGGNLEEIQVIRAFEPEIKVSLFDQMGGWVRRKVRELVEAGERPRIRREDFDKELIGLVRRVSVARLSAIVVPFNPNVDVAEYETHGFVKQLDWINMDEDAIREAILDYIHAENTRIFWTDRNAVSESALMIYERDLKKAWEIARRRSLRKSLGSDELKGQECLDLTLEQDSYIHNEIMPKTITSGNFHALAHFTEEKEPIIGWHPQFNSLKGSEC